MFNVCANLPKFFRKSSVLWSNPAGARQVRAKALRRRAPRALLRKLTYTDKTSYACLPPCILCEIHNTKHRVLQLMNLYAIYAP